MNYFVIFIALLKGLLRLKWKIEFLFLYKRLCSIRKLSKYLVKILKEVTLNVYQNYSMPNEFQYKSLFVLFHQG